eukprot:m.61649 g.61649  ORF g.61649 m.61649 type:complete len:340 (-) comp13351_c0_seq1:419-1438(-)
MKSAIVLACVLLALLPAALATSDFDQFKSKFNKTYESAEEEARRAVIFAENLAFIARHNAEAAKGLHTYTLGVNQFADLTNEEFRSRHLSPIQTAQRQLTEPVWLEETDVNSIDWRTKGVVTPVKNQGQCGSCWVFATTAVVESAHAIATGHLVALSEQQIMDCSSPYGGMGCNGGAFDSGFKYVVANGGLDSEADYPYTGRDEPCNKQKEARHVATVSSYGYVAKYNETQLAAAVVKYGPIAVGLEADQAAFQMYTSGVFSGPCGTNIDFMAVIVGFTEDYWIVRNDWGTAWGEEGYIMMKRGVSQAGICGIATMAAYVIPGPPLPTSTTPSHAYVGN